MRCTRTRAVVRERSYFTDIIDDVLSVTVSEIRSPEHDAKAL
jgi:hypothetical protein